MSTLAVWSLCMFVPARARTLYVTVFILSVKRCVCLSVFFVTQHETSEAFDNLPHGRDVFLSYLSCLVHIPQTDWSHYFTSIKFPRSNSLTLSLSLSWRLPTFSLFDFCSISRGGLPCGANIKSKNKITCEFLKQTAEVKMFVQKIFLSFHEEWAPIYFHFKEKQFCKMFFFSFLKVVSSK